MELNRIEVEGFKSFQKPQVLELSSLPAGLYYVSGVNEVEEVLEGNGAGKSSLYESVFWALYGKTSRNVRGGNIHSWNYKGPCRVVLETNIGTVRRERTGKGIVLELNGEVIDQRTLETRLRLTPDAFLHSLYLAQFSPCFIDLSPSARMELYSEIMELEFWENKSRYAGEIKGEFESTLSTLDKKCERLQGALSELKIACANSIEEKNRWVTEHRKRMRAVESEVQEAKEALEKARKETAQAEKRLEKVKAEAVTFNNEAEKVRVRIEGLRKRLDEAREGLAVRLDRLKQLKESLKDFEALGPICRHCKQKVDSRHKAKHLAGLAEEIENAEKEVARAKEEVRNRERLIEEQQKAGAARLTPPNVDLAYSMLRAAKDKERHLESMLEHKVKELNERREEPNPWDARGKELERRRDAARMELSKLKTDLQEVRWFANAFDFWARSFKDIRFFVIRESLEQLNAEVNESLIQLGLKDWRIEFELEKETKSGSVKRGFVCSVYSPHTEKQVEWEAWSGGESQRLRLAAQLGIANLILTRSGVGSNFEFLDEPSNWLSEAGIKDLLEVLEERALRYERRILIADHRTLDYPFAGEIRITKSAAGSQIEVV
jgi:DNA repair exonuclease SbcCD ATPase subunit